MDRVVGIPAEAVQARTSGASLAVGGFGLSGIPSALTAALLENRATDREAYSKNCGIDCWGLGQLLAAKQIRGTTSCYVDQNKRFQRQFLSGEVEVELAPQETLAERSPSVYRGAESMSEFAIRNLASAVARSVGG